MTTRKHFVALSNAAAGLMSPEASVADRAFGFLAAAFADVEIPAQLMELSEDERVEVLREASEGLRVEFDAAAASPPLPGDEFDGLADRVNGLWLMVVAALPEKATGLAAVLEQLADSFVQSLTAGGIDPTELLLILVDEDDPRHGQTVALLAALGIQPSLVIRRLNN